jgi:hypothetical protein
MGVKTVTMRASIDSRDQLKIWADAKAVSVPEALDMIIQYVRCKMQERTYLRNLPDVARKRCDKKTGTDKW